MAQDGDDDDDDNNNRNMYRGFKYYGINLVSTTSIVIRKGSVNGACVRRCLSGGCDSTKLHFIVCIFWKK